MARLEDLTVGSYAKGISGTSDVEIIAINWYGTAAAEVTFKASDGKVDNVVL